MEFQGTSYKRQVKKWIMRNFKKLLVWEKSIGFVTSVYSLTNNFPDSEKFGLTSQIRRASVSISSNIAEGCSRKSDLDFKRFLQIALGSAFEVETQLIISTKLKYIDLETSEKATISILEIQKMISGLMIKI